MCCMVGVGLFNCGDFKNYFLKKGVKNVLNVGIVNIWDVVEVDII